MAKWVIVLWVFIIGAVWIRAVRKRNLTLRKYAGLQENIYIVNGVVSADFIQKIQTMYSVVLAEARDTQKAAAKHRKFLEISGNKLGVQVVEIRFKFPAQNVNETVEIYTERCAHFIAQNRVERHADLQKKGLEFYDKNVYENVVSKWDVFYKKSGKNYTGFETQFSPEKIQ